VSTRTEFERLEIAKPPVDSRNSAEWTAIRMPDSPTFVESRWFKTSPGVD
jgi:hypothetical protein